MLGHLRALAVGLATTLHAVAAIGLALFDRGGRLSSAVIGAWSRAVLRLAGVSVVVEGRERLPSEGPLLCLSSHRSLLDVPALYQLLPARTRFVAKRELFRIPLFGLAIRLLGFVPIDRADRRGARAAMESAATLAHDDRPLVVFPEGTRSLDGSLLPFKKGAFAIALEHRLPIVTLACLDGELCLPPGRMAFRPGRMTVRVGRTFRPEEPAYASRQALAHAVRSEMEALLAPPPGSPQRAQSSPSRQSRRARS
jgi:1-acyl-sn-glycerol-3-phosphate acyltransferase